MKLPETLLDRLEDLEPGDGATVDRDAFMTIITDDRGQIDLNRDICSKVLTSADGLTILIEELKLEGHDAAEIHGVQMVDEDLESSLHATFCDVTEV